jgi:hypothetical protein
MGTVTHEFIASLPAAQKWGAMGFGAVIGWFAYFINRYRKDVVIGDLATVIAAVGGAAILALFPAKTDLFGFYGIGLAVGFFAYFAMLLIFVGISKEFGLNWFLDGRRTKIPDTQEGPGPDPNRGMGGGTPVI